MAVELRLRKADVTTPWGFRLVGGADYETPLAVVKVTENSLAENAGMQVGDFIVRINDVSTRKLTHMEAHDVILKAGNEFVLGVRRGGLPQPLLPSATSTESEDVTSTKSAEREDPDLNITDEEIADIIGQDHHAEKTLKESEVLQAVVAEDEANKPKEKKWSTFLQKPKNPVPEPRRPVEEGPKTSPYRVVIKKQPKRSPEATAPIVDKIPKSEVEQEEEEEAKQEEEEEEEEERREDESSDESSELNDEAEQSPPQSEDEEQAELDSYAESSVKESDLRRMSASLEEQLVQVQKQLLALAKLPSAIQSTLNAVTQQLDLIVSVSQQEEEEVVLQVAEEEEEEEKALSTLDEEDGSELAESTIEDARGEEEEDEDETVPDGEEVEEVSQIMTEEELEAQREEQERLEKKEKVNQWNHIWPWSDVTKPVYRINFLKYQPPPKNLDHLQRSEVYRMIHDMEPPIRGIKARETKVLAEQDYYVKKEESAASLSPQMER